VKPGLGQSFTAGWSADCRLCGTAYRKGHSMIAAYRVRPGKKDPGLQVADYACADCARQYLLQLAGAGDPAPPTPPPPVAAEDADDDDGAGATTIGALEAAIRAVVRTAVAVVEGRRTRIDIWTSVAEYQADLLGRDPETMHKAHAYYATVPGRADWAYETADRGHLFSDAGGWMRPIECLSLPYARGLERIHGMIDALRVDIAPALETRRKWRRSEDDGSEIDMDRLRDGASDFWRTMRQRSAPGSPIVSVGWEQTASAAIGLASLSWRGAAAVAIADLLEQAGYRVELVTWTYTHNPFGTREDYLGAWVVKAAQDPIDLGVIAACVSPWAYRIVTFCSHHGIPAPGGGHMKPRPGLGEVVKLQPPLWAELECDHGIQQCFSRESAIAAAKSILLQYQ